MPATLCDHQNKVAPKTPLRKKQKTAHSDSSKGAHADDAASHDVIDLSQTLASSILASVMATPGTSISVAHPPHLASRPVPVQLECDSDMECADGAHQVVRPKLLPSRKRKVRRNSDWKQQKQRQQLLSQESLCFVDDFVSNILTSASHEIVYHLTGTCSLQSRPMNLEPESFFVITFNKGNLKFEYLFALFKLFYMYFLSFFRFKSRNFCKSIKTVEISFYCTQVNDFYVTNTAKTSTMQPSPTSPSNAETRSGSDVKR